MSRRILGFFILIIWFFSNATPVFSQSQNDLPVYIVQAGDTLGTIAQRFGVSLDELIKVNNIANANSISVGMNLKIPGLNGIQGTLTTQPVPLGETFASLATRYQISQNTLAKLNRITNPQEIFAGAALILPQDNKKGTLRPFAVLNSENSILEVAASHKLNPWTMVLSNQKTSSDENLPGSTFFTKDIDPQKEINTISPLLQEVQITPLPLVQGKTTVIRITTLQPVELNGILAGNKLHFYKESENVYVALQGIHAMANPGLTDFHLNIVYSKADSFDFEGMVILKSGFYPNDPPLIVDPKTIEPAITQSEEEFIAKIISPSNPEKYWDKIFLAPVDAPWFMSTFGNRRSFNGSRYEYFHGGIDFGVSKTLNIYAAADGIVAYSGSLSIRGIATIIDHGWGVYSGYWHQKETKVKTGDHVKAGDLIGLIGGTGRVTGPHLHWEIIVNGIQVEPVDWLEKKFP